MYVFASLGMPVSAFLQDFVYLSLEGYLQIASAKQDHCCQMIAGNSPYDQIETFVD